MAEETNLPSATGAEPNQSPPAAALSIEELTKSLMAAYDGYQALSIRLAPFNTDVFIASKGYKVLDEMMNMVPVRAAVNMIRDAVLYKGWKIVPAVNQASKDYQKAKDLADALTYCLNNIADDYGNSYDLRQSLWELLYAVHMGFHVQEIHWRLLSEGDYAGRLGLKQFADKPCRQMGFDLDTRTLAIRAFTSYTPLTGYSFNIPVEKVIHYKFASVDGLPYGAGVGRAAYKHSWGLDFLYRFWNIALETFGVPFITGTAPAPILQQANQIVALIRQGIGSVLPQGCDVTLQELSGNSLAAFKAAAEHHTQQIAQAYLYNTLSTGEGQRSGSLALGQVHAISGQYNLDGRRRDIETVFFKQFIRRWVIHNYGPEALALAPTLSLGDWDAVDTKNLADGYSKLVATKILHPGEEQIRERLGLAPLAPDLREKMENAWNASLTPTTIPATPETEDDPTATDDTETETDDSEEQDD